MKMLSYIIATGVTLLLVLIVDSDAIVLQSTNPLLDLNDQIIQSFQVGGENEVVCPAALYHVIAAAYDAGNDRIREVIAKALRTSRPDRYSRLLEKLAAEEKSLRQFFRAYSSPEMLEECVPTLRTTRQKDAVCERLVALLTERGRQLDFSDLDVAVKEINAEVSEATDGLITDLFTDLSEATRMVFASAFTFSSPWFSEINLFDVGLRFNTASGQVSVPAVKMLTTLRFLNDTKDNVLAASLPYRNPNLEMFFFMSSDDSDIVKKLKRKHYEQLAHVSPLENMLAFTFPKFAVTSKKRDYEDVARAMGLGAIFEGGLGPEGNDKVDQMVQRSVIQADEEGTTAAGAAGVSLIPRVGFDDTEPSTVFELDRPFVCTVYDSKLGAALFTAYITDPRQG